MIADLLLPIVETEISTIPELDCHIVPETEAFPTSGHSFIQVKGDSASPSYHEMSIKLKYYFTIITSIRTRQYPTQRKRVPYLELIDISEQVLFKLLNSQTLYQNVRTISPDIEFTERFLCKHFGLNPIAVQPEFFGSDERSLNPIREAGYMLTQSWESPTFTIPWRCLQTPSSFQIPD